MIKEYKLPGLYVLGVPEKSLISFVTFSLSFLVLTVSYLLYFYFRGCPVELALLPPVDKLGEPVDIAFDAVDELSGKDVAQIEENIAIDAVATDPGNKPSLTARLFGIFKKSKVPEEVIEEPESKEEIQESENVVVETDVPETPEEIIEIEEETEEENPTLTEKIVGFFKKSDTEEEEATETPVEEGETGVISENEEVGVELAEEEETEEENPSLTEKIVGFFQKSDTEEDEASKVEEGVTDIIEESEELPVEEADQDDIPAENSIKAVVQSFLGTKEDTSEETVAPQLDDDDSENEASAQEEIPSIEDTDEKEAEIEGSCEDLPEDKSLREKIWNFFGCGEKEVTEVPEEQESITTIEEEIEEAAGEEEEEEIPAENSIKAVVQSFLGTKEEVVDTDAVTEEDNTEEIESPAEEEIVEESTSIKDKIVEFFQSEETEATDETPLTETTDETPLDETTEEMPLTEEIGEIEDANDNEAELEGSCEDLPEDKSLREKIWNFFGCGEKEEASVAEEETGSAEESEALPAEVEEIVETADESIDDEIPSENSIKAAVQSFLGTNKEITPEDISEESTITDQGTEAIEEEVLATDGSEIVHDISEEFEEAIDEKDEEEVEESVSDVPLEIFGEAMIEEEEVTEKEEVSPEEEEEVTEVVIEETATLDKPTFKERIINFFRRSKPSPVDIPVEEVVVVEETVPETEAKVEKESIKTKIGKFFNIFQSKPVVSDLETEIAETIVNGNLKDMIENSEKEPIVVDTIGLCPEVTKDNWLQLFMGRSFLCFVSFSLNLSVLIASYLLYF